MTAVDYDYQQGTCDIWQVAHLCNHMAGHGWEPILVFDAHYPDAQVTKDVADDHGPLMRALKATGVLFRRPIRDEDEQ